MKRGVTFTAMVLMLLSASELIHLYFDWPQAGLVGCFAFLLLALSLRGQFRAREWLLVIISAALAVFLVHSEGGLDGTLNALQRASFFAAFIYLVTLLKEAAQLSPSVLELGKYLTRQRRGRRYYSLAVGGHVMGVLLNFGAISLLTPLIQRGAKASTSSLEAAQKAEQQQISALLRGFSWMIMWSPTALTRVALMTGRHPVRTGLTDVIFPGNPAGLAPEEVTIAELLSDAGYATAMYGKWHLGDGEETWPHNQGFDETLFGIYNAAPWAWNTPDERVMWNNFSDTPDFFFRAPLHGKMEGKKGEKAVEVSELNKEAYVLFEEETFNRSMEFINRNANGDKPFFLYWASNLMSQFTSHPDWLGKSAQGTHNGDQMMEHDHYIGQMMKKLQELGIAENTLVVWMSDNGPMYDLFPESSYTALRGGKGDVLERGVRVPAVAWWPGVIGENQIKAEMLHVTDMYTTAARITT